MKSFFIKKNRKGKKKSIYSFKKIFNDGLFWLDYCNN